MGQIKMLIVDDEAGLVFFIQKYYNKHGVTTFGATDGIKAVEIFQKERPDITLIDIHMPYSPIDGIEVLERIKNIDKDAYCAMVTKIADKESMQRSKELGARHYIRKPYDVNDLDKCIAEVKGKTGG